jgi:splicing factor U2AF subunit
VSDGPNKVFIGGLPYHLTDENVKELLSAFGPLKSFHLVREAGSITSRGYGFCEYVDPQITAIACEGLNNMQIGEKTLTVRIASSGNAQGGPPAPPAPPGVNPMLGGLNIPGVAPQMGMGAVAPPSMGIPGMGGGMGGPMGAGMGMGVPQPPPPAPMGMSGMSGMSGPPIAQLPPTRVLILKNMVTPDELNDDAEYQDIIEDVRGECSNYGEVDTILIPRQREGYPASCEGNIYTKFTDPNMARNAAMKLSGRKFADRTVIVEYFDEGRFQNRMFG